jgi:hypothetical protein
MSAETGFHDVPWDVNSANAGSLDGLPPAPERHDEICCKSGWVGSTDDDDPFGRWVCTQLEGHTDTHRAGDSVSTLAEWRDEDVEEVSAR